MLAYLARYVAFVCSTFSLDEYLTGKYAMSALVEAAAVIGLLI
jgi:hypothetical protein